MSLPKVHNETSAEYILKQTLQDTLSYFNRCRYPETRSMLETLLKKLRRILNPAVIILHAYAECEVMFEYDIEYSPVVGWFDDVPHSSVLKTVNFVKLHGDVSSANKISALHKILNEKFNTCAESAANLGYKDLNAEFNTLHDKYDKIQSLCILSTIFPEHLGCVTEGNECIQCGQDFSHQT